ncbi:hypothetical protein Poli38472_001606 [Pythium oligandrum]|uniref:Uncharacterized protein n=1 Tax=Pythium oligandrum TaxID=41045 RepID=A0A8K1FMJ9_PYTOL|nr:hypothetical protein Poli38472_001606 [Pythium oligandrum]|eukprot:TMW69450.1 hypothetical protein Poli38472_001606 [Pythium oligandrum]
MTKEEMSMEDADLNPVLTEQLQSVLDRFDKLYGILVSTVEGVPLLKVTREQNGLSSYEYAETVLPTVFAGAAEQIGKLKFGQVKSITSFFGDLVLLHVNDMPLVLTLVTGDSSQLGVLQVVAMQLRDALYPLKRSVESADVH